MDGINSATAASSVVNQRYDAADVFLSLVSSVTSEVKKTALARFGMIAKLKAAEVKELKGANEKSRKVLVRNAFGRLDSDRIKKLKEYNVQLSESLSHSSKAMTRPEEDTFDDYESFVDLDAEDLPALVGLAKHELEEPKYNEKTGMFRYTAADHYQHPGRDRLVHRTVIVLVRYAREEIAKGIPPGDMFSLKFYEKPDYVRNRLEAVADTIASAIGDNPRKIPGGIKEFCVNLSVYTSYRPTITLLCRKLEGRYGCAVHTGKLTTQIQGVETPLFKIRFDSVGQLEIYTDSTKEGDYMTVELGNPDTLASEVRGACIEQIKSLLESARTSGYLKEAVEMNRAKLLRTENYDHTGLLFQKK